MKIGSQHKIQVGFIHHRCCKIVVICSNKYLKSNIIIQKLLCRNEKLHSINAQSSEMKIEQKDKHNRVICNFRQNIRFFDKINYNTDTYIVVITVVDVTIDVFGLWM